MNSKKSILRTLVRSGYDMQHLRIRIGNQLVAAFKSKLGLEAGVPEEESEDEDTKELLKSLRADFTRISDKVALVTKKNFEPFGAIETFSEYIAAETYLDLEKKEKRHFSRIESVLEDFEVWNKFLSGISGIGPAMGGIIVSEIDIHKAKYPSSLWVYSGLDVVVDTEGLGSGRSRKANHLVEKEYTNFKGEQAVRKSITFNPFLKTKLIGVLATSFIRQGKDNTYAQVYYNYKNRLENNPAHVEKSKGHRHAMALRYMIKIFLIDLHREWRVIEGYEPSIPYAEAKLGLKHSKCE